MYFDLEGVLMNFTKNAALALDNLQIPVSKDGILSSPNPVYKRTTNEVLYDICHGFDFYEVMEKYMWSDIIFQEAFMAANENVYFIARQNIWDDEAWGGKAAWVKKNFGSYGYNHLVMVSDAHSIESRLRLTKSDILIDDDLDGNIAQWCRVGGAGFHWTELDWRSDQEVLTKEIYRRIAALKLLISNSS